MAKLTHVLHCRHSCAQTATAAPPRYFVSVPYRGEHCQAANRAAADIEGHSEAAKFSEPGRLSGGINVALPPKAAAAVGNRRQACFGKCTE